MSPWPLENKLRDTWRWEDGTFKTKSLDGTKPRTDPKINSNPHTNPNPKLT